MNLSARMVVMSHLSDVQETLSYNERNSSQHINFAKFIIGKTNGDLTQMIDADEMWLEFQHVMNNQVQPKRKTIVAYNTAGVQVESEEIFADEIKEFIQGDIMNEIIRMLKTDSTTSGRISTIQYLKKQGADKEKFIGLRYAKDIIYEIADNL